MGNLDKILDQFGAIGKGLKAQVDKLSKISGVNEIISALESNFDVDVVAKKIEEVEDGAIKVVNVFGAGREHIVAIKANLVDSVTEVTKLGKGFDDIVNAQVAISEELGRNLIVNSNIYEGLLATEMVTGRGAKELVESFKNVGFSISHITEEMETVVDVSRSMGVNAKAVSSQVVSNMEYMNKMNFQGGVEGMAKMAAQATNLRVSVKDTLYFAERMFSPDQAIEMSSALQRLGVTQSQLLDPLRLMDLSMNDPTELQNQIAEMTKQFVDLNEKNQFEIMPGAKLQLMEIAKQMQIPYDTLTKMAIGGRELEDKMQKIRFPKDIADEDTRKLIANMAEFDKKSGEYKVTFTNDVGEVVTKSVTELSKDDVELLEAFATEDKSMTDIAKEQLSVQNRIANAVASLSARTGYAYAATPYAEKTLMAQTEVFEKFTNSLTEKFNVPNLRKQFTETGNDVLNYLETDDPRYLVNAVKKMKNYFIDAFGEQMKEWPKVVDSLKNSTNEFVKFIANMDFDVVKLTTKLTDIYTRIEYEIKMGGGSKSPITPIPGRSPKRSTPKPGRSPKKSTPKPGRDLVSYPGTDNRILTGEFGAFSLDQRDMIIAGDPNKLLGNENNNSKNYINDFFDNYMMPPQQQSTKNIKADGEIKISLDINVNSPQYMSKNEFRDYLEDKGVVAKLIDSIKEVTSNIGRTSDYNILEKNKSIVQSQYY
jgi:hypothetical protein